jgi:hypothetical protein
MRRDPAPARIALESSLVWSPSHPANLFPIRLIRQSSDNGLEIIRQGPLLLPDGVIGVVKVRAEVDGETFGDGLAKGPAAFGAEVRDEKGFFGGGEEV